MYKYFTPNIGYTGLSCETCDYGYTRVNNTLYRGTCVKCDCNGHAETCDPVTRKCGPCQHNTRGENCQMCASGRDQHRIG